MGLVEIPRHAPVQGGTMDDWTLTDYLWDESLNQYPWLTDSDAELWALVPYTWRGEQILVPFAGDMQAATRASVEAVYGPLAPAPHCTVCGSTDLAADGTCPRRLDTITHPKH
jgi:hypothetical protein